MARFVLRKAPPNRVSAHRATETPKRSKVAPQGASLAGDPTDTTGPPSGVVRTTSKDVRKRKSARPPKPVEENAVIIPDDTEGEKEESLLAAPVKKKTIQKKKKPARPYKRHAPKEKPVIIEHIDVVEDDSETTGYFEVVDDPPAEERPAEIVEPHETGRTGVRVDVSRETPMRVLSPLPVINIAEERRKLRVLPSLMCSTCAVSVECPAFEEGSVCGLDEAFASLPVRDVDSVLELMREVVDENKTRWRRALTMEKLANGGMAMKDTTRLGETVLKQAALLVNLQRDTQKIRVTTVQEGAPSQSILATLFGAPLPPPLPLYEVALHEP